MPIWVVYMNTGRGLSLSEVYVIAGIGWVIQAFAEVPTGAFSDTYGRKATLLMGASVLAAGLTLFALLPGFTGQLIAYLVWATGNALISGSDDAMIFDTAATLGRDDEFEALASRSMQVRLLAQVVGSVSGGLAALWDLRAPIFITVVLTLAALVVATRFAEPPRREEVGQQPRRWGAMGTTLAAATRYVRSRPRLLTLLAYTALIAATAFFVPFVLVQPQMQAFMVPVGWFGLIFMGLRLAALAGARYGPRIVNAAGGPGVWLVAAPVLMAAAFLGVAVARTLWLSYLAMLLVAFTNAILRPTTAAVLNRALSKNIRATILSAEALALTLLIAVIHPTVGLIVDEVSLSAAFVFLAGLTVVLFALSFPVRKFTRDAGGTVPPEPVEPEQTEAEQAGPADQ
jgi:MFS family permease